MDQNTVQKGNANAEGGKTSLGGILFNMLKGALIGTGAILPGISGGVLCVIFGIYQPLMALLTHPFRELKKRFWFFATVLFGFAVGVLGISKLLKMVMDVAGSPAMWLFIGLILGTMPSLWQQSGKQGRSAGNIIVGLLAFAVLFVFLLWIKGSGSFTFSPGFWLWLACGALWGLGFIAPGLSPSSIFFFIGVMAPMMDGISRLDMSVILPMGLGLIACALALSQGIGWLLTNRFAGSMHAISGLAMASTVAMIVAPELSLWPATVGQGLVYAACLAAGFAVAMWMERMNRKFEESGLKS
jgi:putative membrane protein